MKPKGWGSMAGRIAFWSPVLITVVLAAAQTVEHEPEREHWQELGQIFRAMAVGPGSVVADVGAGDGFLSVWLAPLVGEKGRVYAEDIAEGRLDRLRKRIADAHLDNIVVIAGLANDPRLPIAQLDSVVILNSYHEMPEYDEMLRCILEALKPGGRLVIAEPSPAAGEQTRAQQTAKHHIGSVFVAEELAHAGFIMIETHDNFAQTPDGGHYSLVMGRRAVKPFA
jgi:precorrin-6B methylase 2